MVNEVSLFLICIEIRFYFKFLFDRGYKCTQKKKMRMGDWMIKLESSENSIIIFSDFGYIFICFAPKSVDIFNIESLKNRMFLFEVLVFYVTNGKINYSQINLPKNTLRHSRLRKLSKEIREFIDKITPYIGNDFDKFQNELIIAGRKYTQSLNR
jgi:hypothetical protein